VAFHETVSQHYPTSAAASHVADLADGGSSSNPGLATGAEAKVDGGDLNPLFEVMVKERVAVLSEAIAELDTRDQLILSLHYQENLNFRQIGEILGLTESRISQLHKGALMALKDKLERLEVAE
jgi:RNA polymerase sigma factor (sigma-70 family)